MNYRKRFIPCVLLLIVSLKVRTSKIAENLLADRRYCGYQHSDDYVRTSTSISLDEFPWMAQLLYTENLTIACSGFLINNRYVLTAAHCLTDKLTMVRLGDHDVKTKKDCIHNAQYEMECSDPEQLFNIERKIKHPDFSRKSGANDIGLIRLSENVIYSDFVRPICLPRGARNLTVNELVTSGWGKLGMDLPPTDLKKRITATSISNEDCSTFYKRYRNITENHMCTIEKDTFSCSGDSGAPLMYSYNNQWEAVGVVSFGFKCGDNYPVVHTKVLNYLEWIHEILSP